MERKARFHKAGKASASTSVVYCCDIDHSESGSAKVIQLVILEHLFAKGDLSNPVDR